MKSSRSSDLIAFPKWRLYFWEVSACKNSWACNFNGSVIKVVTCQIHVVHGCFKYWYICQFVFDFFYWTWYSLYRYIIFIIVIIPLSSHTRNGVVVLSIDISNLLPLRGYIFLDRNRIFSLCLIRSWVVVYLVLSLWTVRRWVVV